MKLPTSLPRILIVILLSSLLPLMSFAGSATWNSNPISGDWNTAANWTPATVPNGQTDVATFDASTITGLSLSVENTQVDSIVFNPGASAFTLTVGSVGGPFIVSGAGVTNNSNLIQNFATVRDETSGYGEIQFKNHAKAGISTTYRIGEPTDHTTGSANTDMLFLNNSSADHATIITETSGVYFADQSTADHATFFNADGAEPGGMLWFEDNTTAGDAIITNAGSPKPAGYAGFTYFVGFSTAGNAVLVAEGGTSGGPGAFVTFDQGSTIGRATVTATGGSGSGNGGIIAIAKDSPGGEGRIILLGNSKLDISFHHLSSGVTIGSLEGEGVVFLGADTLAIGSNNLGTIFTGKIRNGGSFGGYDGALRKIGKGSLTLSNANSYTGGTTISRGALLVTNRNGSGTGTGGVQVTAGALGGNGIIAGAVTVGSGSRPALLAPGDGTSPATLTLQSTLTLNALASYEANLDSNTVAADQVTANGVTINPGATIAVTDLGEATLTAGTVLTIINNTGGTAITGAFDNLLDGSSLSVGNNTYQVSYEGGDGNDLTLTTLQ